MNNHLFKHIMNLFFMIKIHMKTTQQNNSLLINIIGIKGLHYLKNKIYNR
jgi:hypothetical protein